MMIKTTAVFSLVMLALAGCDGIYPPTPKPDYTIGVAPTQGGGAVAIPPGCPGWSNATTDPYDNQPLPQFGCATSRNLAMMVDQPNDLVQGRDPGNTSSGVMAVGSMRRYYGNQTRGLLDTDTSPDTSVAVTTAPTSSSPMTGDVTGGATAPGASAAPAAGP